MQGGLHYLLGTILRGSDVTKMNKVRLKRAMFAHHLFCTTRVAGGSKTMRWLWKEQDSLPQPSVPLWCHGLAISSLDLERRFGNQCVIQAVYILGTHKILVSSAAPSAVGLPGTTGNMTMLP